MCNTVIYIVLTNIVSLKALRGAHLSPSQFEGSSEKLLIKEAEMSPQHYFRDSDGTPRPFYGPFSTSSGRPSPSSTPTPPPYCRTRTMSPIKSLPNQVSKEIRLLQNIFLAPDETHIQDHKCASRARLW